MDDMHGLLFGRKMINLSVDGAKLDSELKVEVSECGLSNNSPLKLRTGHLVFHALL